MPWCDECDELVEDEDVSEHGECPRCGSVLVEERRPVPWYFKAMIAASVVYLGYRAYQGITWVLHHV
jgi:DNA-directed RNA polymerase subunit RPC12/RpoP